MKRPQANARSCFVCGVENNAGLKMRFFQTGPLDVEADYTVPEQFQGYPGIAHGGIVAAMLDEVASRVFMSGDPPRLMVTAKMDIRYRKPVPVGVKLHLVGKAQAEAGRVGKALGQVFDPQGVLLAEADLTVVEVKSDFFGQVPPEETEGWRIYPEVEAEE